MKTSSLNKGMLLLAFVFVSALSFAQATVSGRCTDKNGVALKGVQVTAVMFDERKTVETNGDGFYEQKDLSPGSWTIMYTYNSEKLSKKAAVKNTPIEMNITFSTDKK